jgi:hypothetical protein
MHVKSGIKPGDRMVFKKSAYHFKKSVLKEFVK